MKTSEMENGTQIMNNFELVETNGGYTDPYNIVHRNFPIIAGIADFAEGVAEGWVAGLANWGNFLK
jgi:hypothetical protein